MKFLETQKIKAVQFWTVFFLSLQNLQFLQFIKRAFFRRFKALKF